MKNLGFYVFISVLGGFDIGWIALTTLALTDHYLRFIGIV